MKGIGIYMSLVRIGIQKASSWPHLVYRRTGQDDYSGLKLRATELAEK